MVTNLFKYLLAAALLMGAGVVASATLNVDFGIGGTNVYNGLGAAPDAAANTVWNGLDQDGGSTLLYSDGSAATGISVATDIMGTAGQPFSDGGNALMGDRIFRKVGWTQFDVTISGLSAGSYDLYVYGSHTNYDSLYTVDGKSDFSLGVNSDYPFVHHDNYAYIDGVIVPLSGEVVITVDNYLGADGSAAAVIGGFQLTSVPVPGAAILFGTGLIGLVGFARKRISK
ncbi:MAG: hypothetical protein ABW185_24295 [Sedimenticola sp.]